MFKKGLTPASAGVPILSGRWNSDAFGSPINVYLEFTLDL